MPVLNKILITVGENHFSNKMMRSLEQIVVQNYKIHISKSKTIVVWNIIAQGNAYNNYQLKPPSIITFGCEQHISQNQRINFFKSLSRDWILLTNQQLNDILIGAFDETTFNSLLKRNSSHYSLLGKVKYYTSLITQLLTTTLKTGLYTINSTNKRK